MGVERIAADHIHNIFFTEYRYGGHCMDKMIHAELTLDRIRGKWGISPPSSGYKKRRWSGNSHVPADNFPENGRADDYSQ